MNEVSTQVVFDEGQERLVEGSEPGLQAAAGLGGLGTDVSSLLPPGSATAAKLKAQQAQAAAVQAMHAGQYFITQDPMLHGTAGTGTTWPYSTGGTLGGTGGGRGTGTGTSASLSGLAALQSQLTSQALGASTGQLLGSGWGVLSMAAQNMKAAHLLEQVERTAQHLQSLAAVAATASATTGAAMGASGPVAPPHMHLGAHMFGPTLPTGLTVHAGSGASAAGMQAGSPCVTPTAAAAVPSSPSGWGHATGGQRPATSPSATGAARGPISPRGIPPKAASFAAGTFGSGRMTSGSVGSGVVPGGVTAAHSRVLSGGMSSSMPPLRIPGPLGTSGHLPAPYHVQQPSAADLPSPGAPAVQNGLGRDVAPGSAPLHPRPSHVSTALSEVYSEAFEEEDVDGSSREGGSSIRTEPHEQQGSEGFVEEEVVGSESHSPVAAGGYPGHSSSYHHTSQHHVGGPHGGMGSGRVPGFGGRHTSGSSVPFEEELLSGSSMRPSWGAPGHAAPNQAPHHHHDTGNSYSTMHTYTQDFTSYGTSQHHPHSTTLGGGSHAARGSPHQTYGASRSQRVQDTSTGGGRRTSAGGEAAGVHLRRVSRDGVGPDGAGAGGPLPGDLRAVSRRASIAGTSGLAGPAAAAVAPEHRHTTSLAETLKTQAPIIPDHNTMEPLPGPAQQNVFMGVPAAAVTEGGLSGRNSHTAPATQQQARERAAASGINTLTGMLTSPRHGGEGAQPQPQAPPHLPAAAGQYGASSAYQGTGNAAQDTLLRCVHHVGTWCGDGGVAPM